MTKSIYKIALCVSLVNFLLNELNSISIQTSIIRSSIVFLLTFIIIIIFLNIVQWGFNHITIKDSTENSKNRIKKT